MSTDDDDFFDFDNENFLQGIFDTNKFRKGNKAAECSVTKTLQTENSNTLVSPTHLLKSQNDKVHPIATLSDDFRDNSLNLTDTEYFQKSPCTPNNQFYSPTISLRANASVSSLNNGLEMGNKTITQNTPSKTVYNPKNCQMSQVKRPSPISPEKNVAACKRTLKSVESPKTPVFEKNQFLDRIGTLMSTTSKFNNTSNSTPAKKKKRLSERLGLSNQSSGALLENICWKNMLSESDIFSTVLQQFNIIWTQKMFTLNTLPNEKVPLLIVSVKTINEKLAALYSVTLQDKTAEIEADIHWKNSYFENVEPGDVLLLRQVSVLTSKPSIKKCSLIIIPSNIICVWQSHTKEARYCAFTKQHLTAKVRLWLKELGSLSTQVISNDVATIPTISNTCEDETQLSSPQMIVSASPDISGQSKSNNFEEDSIWEDDTFEKIVQEDNFDEMFKDDDDELLATLNF